MAFLDKHKVIETHATLLLVLSFLVVTIGGIVQIVPLFYLENTIEDVAGVRPYTPLELATTVWRPSRCMTTRSNGGQSGPGRIWHGLAGAIRTRGMWIT